MIQPLVLLLLFVSLLSLDQQVFEAIGPHPFIGPRAFQPPGLDQINSVSGMSADSPSQPDGDHEVSRPIFETLSLVGLGGFLGSIVGSLCIELVRHLLANRREAAIGRRNAKQIVRSHVDPILKSSEELVSRLNLEIVQDFTALKWPPKSDGEFGACSAIDDYSFVYCLIEFWARLEQLRLDSMYVDLADDEVGAKLLGFVKALESREIRLVDRHVQRYFADFVMRRTDDDHLRIISISEFIASVQSVDQAISVLQAITPPDDRRANKKWRQRVIQYGVVVHMLMRELDPHQSATRPHSVHINKMTLKTRRSIKYRVIGRYLPDLRDPISYHGLPEKE
jgi:hypothetical protein